MTTRLADAALLAAQAPPGGVLDPKDESAPAAYLDLRDDRSGVALSKLAAVGAAFGPSLYVQERLRLVVASGELPPQAAAAALARELPDPPSGAGPMIAVVRGEDLLGRLEELMLAGCALGDPPLRDEPRSPRAAWAPAGAQAIAAALAAGARVVVSRFATPEDAAQAIAADESGEPIDEPPNCPVRLEFAEGYRLLATFPNEVEIARLQASLSPEVIAACECSFERNHEGVRLNITSQEVERVREAARRMELAAPVGTVRRPLVESIETLIEQRVCTAPSRLVEFGHDLRPAGEWVDG